MLCTKKVAVVDLINLVMVVSNDTIRHMNVKIEQEALPVILFSTVLQVATYRAFSSNGAVGSYFVNLIYYLTALLLIHSNWPCMALLTGFVLRLEQQRVLSDARLAALVPDKKLVFIRYFNGPGKRGKVKPQQLLPPDTL